MLFQAFTGIGNATAFGLVLAPLIGPFIALLTYLWTHRWRSTNREEAVRRIDSTRKAAAFNTVASIAILFFGIGPAFEAGSVGASTGMEILQVLVTSSPIVIWTSLLSLPVLHLQMRRAREEQGERCARNRGPSLVTVLLYELAVWLTAVAMACVRLVP